MRDILWRLTGGLTILLSVACGDTSSDPDSGAGSDSAVVSDSGVDAGGEAQPPGGLCNCDADCQDVEGHEGVCIEGICFTRGSADCSAAGSSAECAAGSRCWMTGEIPVCWADCAAYDCAGECDDDGSCAPTPDTGCDPACGTACSTPASFDCSAERPDGDCPSGQVCEAGTCVPFMCDDTIMEPNETSAAAVAYSEATDGLQICVGDNDWFSFTPTESGVLHMVGVHSNYGSGNLDVELHDSGADKLTEAWLGPMDYHEEEGRGPLDFEGFTVHGAASAETLLLHVFGFGGAVNDYDLIYRTIPWVDGSSCSGAGFSAVQCTANSGGSLRLSELIMFPVAYDGDPYVGAGFTAVSGFNGTSYIPTSAHYGRRDLVMAIRYAMHTVQETFPDTAPLGIGEIGMPNGTTPAGHPNFTHHYGSAADISYFIRPEVQRAWGQLSYRQICNDAATLRDWSCVDTDGSAGQYGECITGCGDGHIVDIPRTARFLAALAESGRLRVYGVDTAVDDELDAELARLDGAGVAGAAVARTRMASADTDGSWVWHFNHMHVSFE